MSAGAGGFGSAPVSKGLFLTATTSSVIWQAGWGASQRVSPFLSPFVKTFVFQNTGELMFGVYLLYYFRILERQAGSAKFASFAFVVGGLSFGLETAVKTAYQLRRALPTGPYGLIFAAFVPFIVDIPPSTRFTLFGLPMSDKAFVYLAGLQLVLSSGVSSMMAAACGLLAGLTYRTNIFGLRRFKFPDAVNKFFSRTIGRLLDNTRPGPLVRMYAPRNQQMDNLYGFDQFGGLAGQAQQRQPQVLQPTAHRVTASPEAIEQLTAMGFDETRATHALETTDNDVQAAISMLVERGG